jgi:hypothetical protein
MTAPSGGLLRRWLDALLHIDDTPRRTAAAYALGVFFGFSPFLGLHTVLAIACAFALNLNRVAVLLGVYSNLPWIIVAYYAGVTMFGSVLTSVGLPADFRERLVALFELSIWKAARAAHAPTVLAVRRRFTNWRNRAGHRGLPAGAQLCLEPAAFKSKRNRATLVVSITYIIATAHL